MKHKKVILIVTLVIIIPLIIILATRSQKPVENKLPKKPPVKLTINVTEEPVKDVNVTTLTVPPITYDDTSSKKMIDNIEHRQVLSSSDKQTKELLSSNQNPIKLTDKYSIEYITAADEFLVEILDTNINQAKTDAAIWFRSQGISQEGICKLPVVFFMNYGVANQIRGLNIKFNPLAPGC
jgi:uncharacterized alpha/beta hydrolase family protein